MLRIAATALALALLAGSASAQYQATVISPSGLTETFIQGAGGSQYVGFGNGPLTGGNNTHALLFSGGAVIDLQPQGLYAPTGVPFSGSFASGVGGGQQVGFVIAGLQDVAVVWSGTPESAVFLATPAMQTSAARATDGQRQVGSARVEDPFNGLVYHAFAWAGSADSAIDIHPDFAFESYATGVSAGRAAGFSASPDGFYNAILWTELTNQGGVNIHPPGYFESVAVDVRGSTIIGYGYPDGEPNHALLWTDNGATVTDIHPAGYFSSFLLALDSSIQVGLASTPRDDDGNNTEHAMVWRGTAASAIDLHPFLAAVAPGFPNSRALGIDADGNIYGYAVGGTTGPYVGVKWSPVTSTCAADFNGDGNLDPDDLSDYIACYFSIPACDRADRNGDSNIDPDDLSDYIAQYFGGCP